MNSGAMCLLQGKPPPDRYVKEMKLSNVDFPSDLGKLMDVDFEPAFFFVSKHSLCLASLLRRSAVCCSPLFCAREGDHQDSLLFL